jgi:hypothetical protein
MRLWHNRLSGWVYGRGLVAVAVVLLVLGYAAALENEKFPYTTAGEACAPWDGPAIALHFSSTPLKCEKGDIVELTVSFWRELPLHDDQTFVLDAKSKWGGASYCKGGEQPCEGATSGTIHIESFTRGKGAGGTYELGFPKLGRVKGSFVAQWCHGRIVCR